MSVVIDARNISKKYMICHETQGSYSTIVESVTRSAKQLIRHLKRPFKKSKSPPQKMYEEFWALKDVSFQILEGDKVGIIGKNGAGKSTLLKILSRIVDPTQGSVTIKGRIASLLEVGTGFHPELTGRENVFLNGAILGMGRSETLKKFDEIVAFSEIEKFLDTPVKYYSSGMYARLGFAIAAHLDPDILIVDEVLAVGDAQFQSKCLKKLNCVSEQGKTVIFVSHSTQSLSALCNKGILIEKGKIKVAGLLDDCLSEYIQESNKTALLWKGEVGSDSLKIREVALHHDKEFFLQNEKTTLTLSCELYKNIGDALLGIEIHNSRGQTILYSHVDKTKLNHLGPYELTLEMDWSLFWEGEYTLFVNYYIPGKKNFTPEGTSLRFAIYPPLKDSIYTDLSHLNGINYPYPWQVKKESLCLRSS